jgi:hypothetical protein
MSKDKEFIPCEQSLELKELGFDNDCIGYYYTDPNAASIPILCIYKPYKNEFCLPAPIYQEAFRWFREKYGIYPIIEAKNYFKSPIKWIYSTCNVNGSFEVGLTNHNTYEEAELACLKKLIEIVKTK